MKIFAPAKLNLCLDVLKETVSGRHKIQTIYLELKNPHDTIEIKETRLSDRVSTSNKHENRLITHENNLAFKALKLFKQKTGIKKFFEIKIHKKIPLSSGLGGASSDAAAVLKGLNKLCKTNLSTKKLLSLAAKLGSDVPFFIIGGCALGTNFGEKLTPLPIPKNLKIKLHFPKLKTFPPLNKTANAYAALNLKRCGKNKSKTKSKKFLIENIHNDFETIFAVQKGHHICGSGPTTFTIS